MFRSSFSIGSGKITSLRSGFYNFDKVLRRLPKLNYFAQVYMIFTYEILFFVSLSVFSHRFSLFLIGHFDV